VLTTALLVEAGHLLDVLQQFVSCLCSIWLPLGATLELFKGSSTRCLHIALLLLLVLPQQQLLLGSAALAQVQGQAHTAS
jgi:hypothetical protein